MLTKQYLIKSLGLSGHHMTPSDAYTKWIESYYVAASVKKTVLRHYYHS